MRARRTLELADGRVSIVGDSGRERSASASSPQGQSAARRRPARHRARTREHAVLRPDRGSTASGVHAMIVEVDPETRWSRSERYVVVHDCGTIINPLLVEGQIHGGVAHGIGNAFYEQLVYDEQGQLLNASFMDYLLPTATDVPPIETDHRETPSPFNPIGLKGVGRGRLHSDRAAVRAGDRRCAGPAATRDRAARNSAQPQPPLGTDEGRGRLIEPADQGLELNAAHRVHRSRADRSDPRAAARDRGFPPHAPDACASGSRPG